MDSSVQNHGPDGRENFMRVGIEQDSAWGVSAFT